MQKFKSDPFKILPDNLLIKGKYKVVEYYSSGDCSPETMKVTIGFSYGSTIPKDYLMVVRDYLNEVVYKDY